MALATITTIKFSVVIAVVGPDVNGNAAQDEQVRQNVDHIDRLETMRDIILIGGWTANRASAGIWT